MHNLLFVFADQWRGFDLGCAGNPDVLTPCFDRFASQGVRFTHSFASNPVCCPNRAILLTGQHSARNKVIGNDLPLPPSTETFGEVASRHGYATGYIGKWHLDGMPRDKFTPPGPRRHGFDYWAAYNCFHDYFHPRYFRDRPKMIETSAYEPILQTDLAIEFLRNTGQEQPFCLFLSYGPPHDPYDQVPENYQQLYEGKDLQLRRNVVENTDNPLASKLNCRETLRNYYAAITALDDQFARLLQTLDELDLAGNTLVVLTSDHGDMLWSHDWMKKQMPYEESVSVPLLARLPGVLPAGEERNELVSTCDLLPTIAGMLGWELLSEVDGLDLSPFWVGQGHLHRPPESILLANTMIFGEAVHQSIPEWRGIRTKRYTYVEKVGSVPWLLFDNERDPLQLNNLASLARHAGLRNTLARELDRQLERAEDPFLDSQGMLEHLQLEELWEDNLQLRDSFALGRFETVSPRQARLPAPVLTASKRP